MPWIDEEKCTGCGICVGECPVDTIIVDGEKYFIEMGGCIRCAVCHEVCPTDAVRHDSELEQPRINSNIDIARRNMKACKEYLSESDEKSCLERTIKHFKREEMIARETVLALEKIKEEMEVLWKKEMLLL